jgi:hypothetical protein
MEVLACCDKRYVCSSIILEPKWLPTTERQLAPKHWANRGIVTQHPLLRRNHKVMRVASHQRVMRSGWAVRCRAQGASPLHSYCDCFAFGFRSLNTTIFCALVLSLPPSRTHMHTPCERSEHARGLTTYGGDHTVSGGGHFEGRD